MKEVTWSPRARAFYYKKNTARGNLPEAALLCHLTLAGEKTEKERKREQISLPSSLSLSPSLLLSRFYLALRLLPFDGDGRGTRV